MDNKLVEKFFANQTTPHESKKVLEWFETAEGAEYLQNRLQEDFQLLERDDLRSLVPELESENLYQSIQNRIRNKSRNKSRNVFTLKRSGRRSYALKAAAAVLVIAAASVLTIYHQQFIESQIAEAEPIVFQTVDEQHREIRLGDGTVVRMNSNSELFVSNDFNSGTREITLTGEAFFDVAHNPDQPFIVHSNQSSVEVLGTAFNVRSLGNQNNVQVAVIEGVVSFKNRNGDAKDQGVILSEGQYGYMDLAEGSITVDEIAVENYLAWKNGRFIFDGLALHQVCLQLTRLYDVSCGFNDVRAENLQLTANFADDSLEKTLEVIALSLQIDFSMDGDVVHWIMDWQ